MVNILIFVHQNFCTLDVDDDCTVAYVIFLVKERRNSIAGG